MSAFSKKTPQSLRDAFKAEKSNVALEVWVKAKWESGISEESDERVQQGLANLRQAWVSVDATIAQIGIKNMGKVWTSETIPFAKQIRATKDQLEKLAKNPDVALIALNPSN